MTPHRFSVRVYYEDTDLAGIVYYASYLKFIERARSEWVRKIGVDQRAMKAQGIVFAVRRVEADYIAAAVFEDDLIVETTSLHKTNWPSTKRAGVIEIGVVSTTKSSSNTAGAI